MMFIEIRCDKCQTVGISRHCFYAHQLRQELKGQGDIYCCPEHECELCRGTGNVTDLRAAVWGEDAARDHK